jgi:hypothetical protein
MANTDIMLAPGEQGLYSRSFRPNLILFWLRTTLLVTNKRIAVKGPNTILGVIPLGYEERSMPIGSVAGVTANVRVRLGRLVLFGLLALACFVWTFSDGFSFLGFLFTLIFAALAANAILNSLTITNNGGGTSDATVSILDSAALSEFKDRANEYIYSSSTSGTSWNQHYAAGSEGFQNQHGQPYSGPTRP